MTISPFHQRQTYDYSLPSELIAQQPLAQRDASKLLMANRTNLLRHHHFRDLPELLPHDALLIMNDSKVMACRLFGTTTTGASVELFLLEQDPATRAWQCLAKPLRKLKVGSKIFFGTGQAFAEVTARPQTVAEEVPVITVTLNTGSDDHSCWLANHGVVPLPPYIERAHPQIYAKSHDRQAYQTVYAAHEGSAAAPTAGLHFTTDLLTRLAERGIDTAYTTLHVGSGTFLPVKSDNIQQHKMHSERYCISADTVDMLIEAQKQSRPIVAVGTTSLRSLEAFARLTERNPDRMRALADSLLRTDLFIYPDPDRSYVNPSFARGMITNFHQPESSLLMLVAAIMGVEHTKYLYKTAIEHQYRFFSYGDACLLWFDP